MPSVFSLIVFSLLLVGGCQVAPKRSDAPLTVREQEFVDMARMDPSIRLDLRYATTNNFTGKKVYPMARCLLRRPVAERLSEVQRELKAKGLGLKIWDAYRPISVQVIFWKIMPDERYVLQPVFENGKPVKGSKHNRGAAVDVTLVDARGREVEMPTLFDDFSERAGRDFQGNSPVARRNMKLLEEAMVRHGFVGYPTEWWHFDIEDWERYPLADVPLKAEKR
ncbi:MAG: M15 family metallopeptidase [Verrucomicrobiae bacterium]|nr:M15 family metallopeptidase [Verrucomicrobiae bacterium]